ncbi:MULTISPECIES: hypothetical protein [unclassified Streptomyces]|uniref:hypothetical protein n=1 Tax=unclassified Streptomyces TaxID=2593676 RepID=UPI0033177C56
MSWQPEPPARTENDKPHYTARVPVVEVDTAAFEETEKAAIAGHRWWTVAELVTTLDVVRPTGLPGLLASLPKDGPPIRRSW